MEIIIRSSKRLACIPVRANGYCCSEFFAIPICRGHLTAIDNAGGTVGIIAGAQHHGYSDHSRTQEDPISCASLHGHINDQLTDGGSPPGPELPERIAGPPFGEAACCPRIIHDLHEPVVEQIISIESGCRKKL